MTEQVTCILHPFLNFMNSYSASKAHNMLALMLDLHFKDFSLVGDYVDHTSAIQIACAYDVHFILLTHQELIKRCTNNW
jgi:hypothetical protein